MRSNDNKITTMVLAALLTALTLLCTFMLKIPIGVSGYIHLGDAIMFLGVIILPRRYACFAGPVGATLADIFGGFAVWAPWTFFIKLASVIVFGFALDLVKKDGTAKKVFGVPVAELTGYILAIVIGGRIFGVIGILLAIPFAAICDYVYRELFIKKLEYERLTVTEEIKEGSEIDVPIEPENKKNNKK